MKKLVVNVDPQGNVTIEDDHGGGSDIAADLERELGEVTSRRQTCVTKKARSDQKIQQKC